jgi:transcriptional regulator GlxA family with amidase domain
VAIAYPTGTVHDRRVTPHREILTLGFDQAQSLDITGPAEVFDVASRLASGGGRYRHRLASPDGEPFKTSSGLVLHPDVALVDVSERIDTLILAGGLGVEPLAARPDVMATIGRVAARSRRVASVCTGALVLATAGLLDGRRATTHWAATAHLAERFPSVEVEPDSIYVRDGDVWTSAGVTAGIDLALALVEADHGRDLALEVARWLVVFAKRPGGQAQFSRTLSVQLAERAPIRAAQEVVLAHPERPLTVEVLAEHAQMSVRGFARAFRREVGVSPAAYVEAVRVDRAVDMLAATGAATARVAEACGFGTVETFRRAFRRQTGTSPAQYRDRFRRLPDRSHHARRDHGDRNTAV